jgi:cysteine-rich repeat protein
MTLLVLLAAVLVSVSAAAACPDARYLLVTPVRLVGGAEIDVIEISGDRLTLGTGCTPVRVSQSTSKKGTRLKGRRTACEGVARKPRLRARIDPSCETMEGKLIVPRTLPRRRAFSARRSRCGDRRTDPGNDEECDGGCGANQRCSDRCRCEPVTVITTSTTTSTVPSTSRCGNGQLEAGEICDGDDLGGFVCPEGGLAGCFPDCSQLDVRGCHYCGNGRREGPDAVPPGTEECDAGDLGGATCQLGGPLMCTGGTLAEGGCRLDRSGCWECGNDRLDPGEECDDANTQSGDGCSASCVSECGNGTLEGDEHCDDGERLNGDGCSSLCTSEMPYDGGGDDARECSLEWAVAGITPAATVTCADGDPCDRGGEEGECTFRLFFCLAVSSSSACSPLPLESLALTGASLAGPTALGAAAQDAFLGAVSARVERLPGIAVTREGVVLTVDPPLDYTDVCGRVDLAVPAGAARDVHTVVTDTDGVTDTDRITLECEAEE